MKSTNNTQCKDEYKMMDGIHKETKNKKHENLGFKF